jgi:peptidoglycan hydrolase-like protein with peptidoglycan-binding domain
LYLPALADADAPVVAKASLKLGKRTLHVGDRGSAVKALQQLLSAAGYATKADGNFGRGTASVVKRFQRAAHLGATGVASPATLTALRLAASGSVATNSAGGVDADGTPVKAAASQHLGDRVPLKQGMTGHDVKILQDFLTRAGFTTRIDGAYGSGTVTSVKAFETAQQRAVDGILDADDLAALKALVASGTTANVTQPAAAVTAPAPLAPGDRATLGPDGLASAPASAPAAVQAIIAAGNAIAFKPYVYGGGHGKWDDTGYDCSGSVSYALHAAGLLEDSMPSGDFMDWGDPGPGQWVTIYAKGSHMYMIVAGLRFDTSGRAEDGSRWHTSMRSASGYSVVHPPGL